MINEKEFIKAMDILIDKPGMYGINSIENIYNFVTAEIYFNRNIAVEDWSGRFNLFVMEKLNNRLTNFHWYKLIRLYSGSDSHSIQLFKDLFLEFTQHGNVGNG